MNRYIPLWHPSTQKQTDMCHVMAHIRELAVSVKDDTTNNMTMNFLLHKDIKENKETATAQTAHLVFADTQSQR